MNKQYSSHFEWREKLQDLEHRHAKYPLDLELANKLWNSLDSGINDNLKSGARALKTFHEAALSSQEGMEALASAFMEVFDLTGQAPNIKDFSQELIAAIRNVPITGRSENLQWLIVCLGLDN